MFIHMHHLDISFTEFQTLSLKMYNPISFLMYSNSGCNINKYMQIIHINKAAIMLKCWRDRHYMTFPLFKWLIGWLMLFSSQWEQPINIQIIHPHNCVLCDFIRSQLWFASARISNWSTHIITRCSNECKCSVGEQTNDGGYYCWKA
jgi:hypothetical protein